MIEQLTDYIAHDKAAMDFVNGKADPWGMKVNPSYKKIELPRPEWPLLDDYIPETENTCRQNNPAVYFTQVAAPVTTLRKIAEALLDGWPNVQTRCDVDLATERLQDRPDRPPDLRRPLHARASSASATSSATACARRRWRPSPGTSRRPTSR